MAAQPAKAHRTERASGISWSGEADNEQFKTGPFRLMYEAVHDPNSQVLVACRNDRKLVGKLRAFDHHYNMILEGVNEVWAQPQNGGEPTMRFIPKIFLRGDGVVLVTRITK